MPDVAIRNTQGKNGFSRLLAQAQNDKIFGSIFCGKGEFILYKGDLVC